MSSILKNNKTGKYDIVISLGYDDNGKRKRIKKCGFNTKAAAKAYEVEILNQYKNNTLSTNNIHFSKLIQEYVEYKKKSLKSASTIYNINKQLTNILAITGDIKLKNINNKLMQDIYFKLIDKYSLNYSKSIMNTLKSTLKYACKMEYINKIPDYDPIKSNVKSEKINYWTIDELKYFLEEIKHTGLFLYIPVLIAATTGVRIAELCALKWSDIDFEEGYISINHQIIIDKLTRKLTYTSVLKTVTSKRVISIPKVLIAELKHYKADSEHFILTNSSDILSPNTLYKRFSDSVNRYSNVNRINFHGLRHTHATLLIMNNENIKVVSERLGHNNISTTLNIYTNVLDQNKQNTAALLDNLFK